VKSTFSLVARFTVQAFILPLLLIANYVILIHNYRGLVPEWMDFLSVATAGLLGATASYRLPPPVLGRVLCGLVLFFVLVLLSVVEIILMFGILYNEWL
jgi:hypothetical protein